VTSRERLLRTCSFQPVDRPLHWETLGYWSQTVKRWEGEGLPAGVHPNDYFGCDPRVRLELSTGFTTTPYFPPFEYEVVAEDEETVTYRDQYGITKRDRKEDREMSMPQFIAFPVKGRRDWEEEIRPRLDPDTPGRFPGLSELAARHKGHEYVLELSMCGFYGFPRNLFGEEALAYALYDMPDLIHEMQRHWVRFNKVMIERLCACFEFDYVMIWEDMAFKTGPLISPKMFSEFQLPYYKEVVSHARACGIPHIAVDTDGDARVLLPQFIEAGVDFMMPFEIAASMNPVPIREQYGEKLAIWGGIDKRALARDKAAVDRELAEHVAPMLRSGGYVPSVDHTCPPDIPFENYCYFVERLREMGERHCPKA